MANKLKKVIKGKSVVKGPRKPREFSNKLMGVKKGKEVVNEPSPRNEVIK